MTLMQQTFPQYEVAPIGPNEKFVTPLPDQRDRPPPLHLSRDYRVLMTEGPPNGRLAVMLPDGDVVAVRRPEFRGRPPFWGGPATTMLLFVLVSLSLLGVWAARALSGPLSALAKAAETFSIDNAAAPLPERGPEEIRSVARALNNMRQRITALVDDRTKMLAAISHDLRTPITRMRLRTEFIEDETSRSQMLRDLDQMRAMLDSVLTFLRNDGQLEPMTPTDVATSLQSIADQFADIGHQVSYRGPAHATVNARPGDLLRAVTNLVDNAVRFASEVTIGLTVAPDAVTIDVEDDGPGMSSTQKIAMLQPFVRGDDARTMDQASGFGLGLSIAHAVALAHGGELSLNDREPHGLIVRIKLPKLNSRAS
jgi:signal transduction histidine kinase